ncbi:MAG: lysostaphin resistance A-like protein [Chitinophagales bacterium]
MDTPLEKPRWGWFRIVIVYLVIFIGGPFLYQEYGTIFSYYIAYLFNQPGNPLIEFTIEYLFSFLLMAGGVSIAVLSSGARLSNLGFVSAKPKSILIWGFGGGLIVFFLVTGFGAIIRLLNPNLAAQPVEDIISQVTGVGAAVVLFICIVMQPLAEEMLFRGMIYPVMRHGIGIVWGTVASGILFGLTHGDLWRLLPLSIGGVGLAYLFERSKTIYVPWIAHGLWNGIMAIMVLYR